MTTLSVVTLASSERMALFCRVALDLGPLGISS